MIIISTMGEDKEASLGACLLKSVPWRELQEEITGRAHRSMRGPAGDLKRNGERFDQHRDGVLEKVFGQSEILARPG